MSCVHGNNGLIWAGKGSKEARRQRALCQDKREKELEKRDESRIQGKTRRWHLKSDGKLKHTLSRGRRARSESNHFDGGIAGSGGVAVEKCNRRLPEQKVS